ncbi:MAG: S-ribosylhomocysteine lyase [Firmicutes bacterium]|nr:S-ribosylhomocysteine lyase [Bacillota bacterium]
MEEIKRITSFTVNHERLRPGFYVSRRDGDVNTYDLRTRTPNAGDYMDNISMHSVEHMFATFARNSQYAEHVIYFGPMGCRTGFYFLMRDVSDREAYELTKEILEKVLEYEGPVFGASPMECGNYRELDLGAAKRECRRYLDALTAREESLGSKADVLFKYEE